MRQEYLNFGDFPPSNLSYEEMAAMLRKYLSNYQGAISFESFSKAFAGFIINRDQVSQQESARYSGSMNQKDKNMLREIIWDHIILRYMTPGGSGHDDWPNLTITERGKVYFASFK